MNSTYTAVIKQDASWWIGWIEEVPGVNCQESSREKLLKSLSETLLEANEMNRADALEAVGKVLNSYRLVSGGSGLCSESRRWRDGVQTRHSSNRTSARRIKD